MRSFIVDTDVASFLFKGDTRGQFYKQYVNDDAVTAISFMTLAELKQWAVLRNWGPAKRDELTGFVRVLVQIFDRRQTEPIFNFSLRGKHGFPYL